MNNARLAFLAILLIAQSPLEGAKNESKTQNQNYETSSTKKSLPDRAVTITGTLATVRDPKTEYQTENPYDHSQPFWKEAFEPITWSQWTLVIFAGLAALSAYKAFCATRRQAAAAETQLGLATSPRLYVDSVRASSLEVGAKPVFFVRIVNSGPADAESVAVSIDVRFGDGDAAYKVDHVMLIPANAYREHFIAPGFEIHNLEDLNQGKLPVEISGHFIYKGKEVKYCYKYNTWPFDYPRPDGWPFFVPCDFVATRTIAARMRSGGYSLSFGNVEGKKSSKQ